MFFLFGPPVFILQKSGLSTSLHTCGGVYLDEISVKLDDKGFFSLKLIFYIKRCYFIISNQNYYQIIIIILEIDIIIIVYQIALMQTFNTSFLTR